MDNQNLNSGTNPGVNNTVQEGVNSVPTQGTTSIFEGNIQGNTVIPNESSVVEQVVSEPVTNVQNNVVNQTAVQTENTIPQQVNNTPQNTTTPETNNNQAEANNQTANGNTEYRDITDKANDAFEKFLDTVDHKNEFGAEDQKINVKSAVISYIPLASLYFIVTGKYKNSDYLKFHVNQGLDVTILVTAVSIIDRIVTSLFSKNSLVSNSTPSIFYFLFFAIYFACILLIFFGIVNTSNGLSKELPCIGKFKLLK